MRSDLGLARFVAVVVPAAAVGFARKLVNAPVTESRWVGFVGLLVEGMDLQMD